MHMGDKKTKRKQPHGDEGIKKTTNSSSLLPTTTLQIDFHDFMNMITSPPVIVEVG
jgi:hypothetical protein